MFTPKEHKHEYSFHGDDTLHDQTPEVQGILASLPSGAAAVGQLLVNGTGVCYTIIFPLLDRAKQPLFVF